MKKNELFEILETKSIEDLKNERDTLISFLNKIPDCVSFFKDVEIDGEKFYSDKQYEILKENEKYYFIKAKSGSSKIVSLKKSLEEDLFILMGIINLKEI